MCIDAPESTTNSLSSGFIKDGAGTHHSVGEKKVALSFSLSFETFLSNLHASPRAHRSRLSVSSWDLSSNFEANGLRWRRTLTWIFPSDGPLFSRMFARRCVDFVNYTRRFDPKTCELFLKLGNDYGGSVSWNAQPNCRASFNIVTALLSPFFFGFLLGWPSTCLCANEHLSPNLQPIPTYKIDIREDATCHKVI